MGTASLVLSPFALQHPATVICDNLPTLILFGAVSVGLGGLLTTIGFANLESHTASLLALSNL